MQCSTVYCVTAGQASPVIQQPGPRFMLEERKPIQLNYLTLPRTRPALQRKDYEAAYRTGGCQDCSLSVSSAPLSCSAQVYSTLRLTPRPLRCLNYFCSFSVQSASGMKQWSAPEKPGYKFVVKVRRLRCSPPIKTSFNPAPHRGSSHRAWGKPGLSLYLPNTSC